MQEDTFPAAEKILFDIDNILKKDKNLQSFEIIPVNDNENKSPVYHEENCLALASWCVRPLYCYTYNRLIELRGKKRREEANTTSRWLLGALLINPDISTFWNMRRELVKNQRLEPMQELQFTRIVLYHKAKCFDAFAYRRWLLEFILMKNDYSNGDNIEPLLRNEMHVATVSADRYANNYHAWSHREYVMTTFETIDPTNFGTLLLTEWESSKDWCSQHVSDHSGLSYRQFLLKQLLLLERQSALSRLFFTPQQLLQRREMILFYIKSNAQKSNDNSMANDANTCDCEFLNYLHGRTAKRCSEVDYERLLMALSYWIEDCSINEDLIDCYSGHESLWYHRRFLAYCLRCIEASYYAHSCYKAEFFHPRHCVSPDEDNECTTNTTMEDRDNSSSQLELAFKSHNDKIIAIEEQQTDHPCHIVEKFIKFLTILQLQSLN